MLFVPCSISVLSYIYTLETQSQFFANVLTNGGNNYHSCSVLQLGGVEGAEGGGRQASLIEQILQDGGYIKVE